MTKGQVSGIGAGIPITYALARNERGTIFHRRFVHTHGEAKWFGDVIVVADKPCAVD